MPCPRTGGLGQGQGPQNAYKKFAGLEARARRKEGVWGRNSAAPEPSKIKIPRPDFSENRFGFRPGCGAQLNFRLF